MAQAASGDTVKVHYTGWLKDGTEFDSTLDKDPLEFTIGANEIVEGFEEAVIGMEEGERKKVDLTKDEAYGEFDKEKVHMVARDTIPSDLEYAPGDRLELSGIEKFPLTVTVLDIGAKEIKVTSNHPLAGLDLTFEIELVEVL